MEKYKIVVFGIGYVGLANAIVLAQNNTVVAVDIDQQRVALVNARKSPYNDEEITEFLGKENLDLLATTDGKTALDRADIVVIATPTNYDEKTGYFNTEAVDQVIDYTRANNSGAIIIIKSTLPVGYTKAKRAEYKTDQIIFSPEFLREGKALYDNLYPSRIIVGGKNKAAQMYALLMLQGAYKKEIPVLFTDSCEAEAIKLFSNTYLALRVAFFNELDTYAEINGLNTQELIYGICLDERIGDYYNNPSFGYGGYCLPKDTKQLQANYREIPEKLITAIVSANTTRKDHIANMIVKRKPQIVGFYRLAMKKDSDNFRDSSIIGIIERVKAQGMEVLIYEPELAEGALADLPQSKDLESFKKRCDLIVTNRYESELEDVKAKVYTRDLFHQN